MYYLSSHDILFVVKKEGLNPGGKGMKVNYGILSMVVIGIGVALGIFLMAVNSLVAAGLYFILVLIGIYTVLMNYCRKCPHSMNGSCKHVLPGKLAKKLPYKKTGKYTAFELSTVIGMLVTIFILPLLFTYKNLPAATIYCMIWVVGVIMIRKGVCITCYNRWCMLCPNKANQ